MRLSLITFCALVSTVAFPHAILTTDSDVPPRVAGQGGPGKDIKIEPCAGSARTSTPKTFEVGATITIRGNEFINHPGSYQVWFSPANDTNWVMLKEVTDSINNGNIAISVTLPEVPCEACTIRFVQKMTDRNPATFYHDCGDIKLVAKGTPGTSPVTANEQCSTTAGN